MSTEKIRWPRVILGAIVMLVLWCLLVFAPALVMAQSYTVSWEAPTKCVNGDSIGATPACRLLDGYYIRYGQTHEYELPPIDVEDSKTRAWVMDGLDPTRKYFLVVTAYAPCTIGTTNCGSDGRVESSPSGELTLEATASSPPESPGDMRVVQNELTAYVLAMTENRIALVPVGTVPPDTQCDPDESINAGPVSGAYRVPREVVQLAPGANTQSLTAFAKCEPF